MVNQWRVGKWQTWQDIEQHVSSGELRESHTIEFKRDDYNAGDSGNRELAKDVAAMAIDGGVVVLGIEEDKESGRAVSLSSVRLKGAIERIDQVCGARIQPPLALTVSDRLVDPNDDTQGLITIEVPATGVPHMVDNRYLGRANRTVRYLDHPEVARLLASREADADIAQRNVVEAYDLFRKHGFGPDSAVITATPIPALRPDALRDFVTDVDWATKRLPGLVDTAAERVRGLLETAPEVANVVSPGWGWFSTGAETRSPRRIPRGVSLWCIRRDQSQAHRIELDESGAVRVATDGIVLRSETTEPEFAPRLLMTVAVHALAIASVVAEMADTRTSYGLGVLVRDLAGAYAKPLNGFWAPGGKIRDNRTPYRDDEYLQTTIVNESTLATDLTTPMDGLFGPLLRSIDFGDPFRKPSAP
ncbi:ATP-binding protein [Dactylosporangium sp. NPDC000244]|uniref:AlbA family DNA-binding domain-containing protein n=1 Tax=Dactylosporangium sp. NPDC000244 TaxID=3154365 RepID=UPI00331E475F